MTLSVIGSGAFGTALAIAIAKGGKPVTLWTRSQAVAKTMQDARENKDRLANHSFPDAVTVTANIEEATSNEVLLIAVPMQQLRSVCDRFAKEFHNKTLVACCKGIELNTGLGPCDILSGYSDKVALLTGPSFAHDIAGGLPTALVLACAHSETQASLQAEISTPTLRLYTSGDTVGAELGGAIKNVIAIACGATIGAGLGDSARSALMTRGFAEMQRMAIALGGAETTLSGLSGFGDLSLTCMSEGSRNFRYGLALGRGQVFDTSITVEGVATAKATLTKAQSLGIEMPITACVDALASGAMDVPSAMKLLLSRPQKEE